MTDRKHCLYYRYCFYCFYCFFLHCLTTLLLSSSALARETTPSRIEAIYFDHGQVGKLYLYPGRTALLDFPCEITRAVSGPSGDVQVVVASTEKSELDVWLKSGASQPTNLTVRCGKQVFVFDVVPSQSTHQEYIEIIDSFGGPRLQPRRDLQSDSSGKTTTDTYAHKKLIATSQSKVPKAAKVIGNARHATHHRNKNAEVKR